MTSASASPLILTLSCKDVIGIVAEVAGFLAGHGCNILDSKQYFDPDTGLFFMRVVVASERGASAEALRAAFAPVGQRFAMDWALHDPSVKPRVLLMVSKFGHCLNDLLYRWTIGALPVEIAAVVSNHRDFYRAVAAHGIDFHHIPVTPETKREAEQRLMDIVEQTRSELVVLARYMQVLSDDLCTRLSGRAINIHHSFLPSFKGARPYHQAHRRGVKLIGATAHYVTADLDEGPIIDQEVARVSHAQSPDDLVAIGRDIESVVLARAVLAHVERRVFLNGSKTVVFS
ncbi:MAG TPA: formyltetrahydrofolate deformylase [Beijerinckiaceae bacterium]|nr:formyltetrahydrofolate deformylase [Beijerinckiaceae bacterium]